MALQLTQLFSRFCPVTYLPIISHCCILFALAYYTVFPAISQLWGKYIQLIFQTCDYVEIPF